MDPRYDVADAGNLRHRGRPVGLLVQAAGAVADGVPQKQDGDKEHPAQGPRQLNDLPMTLFMPQQPRVPRNALAHSAHASNHLI